MDIFAYYDCSLDAPEVQPAWVPLWERSWRARGWNPRLITARHARRSKLYAHYKNRPLAMPLLALHAVGGGWLSRLEVINFSFEPKALSKSFTAVGPGIFQATRPALERYLKTGKRSVACSAWCSLYGEAYWL